ncbi:MAG: FAD:protein FMN transferase, partial [Lachnospiraceae bacterium]|nr:FAD:protein FMN transferase [Lachnospiraceae bacterium]
LLLLTGCSQTTGEESTMAVTEAEILKYTNTDFAMGTVISQTVYSTGEDLTATYLDKLTEIEDNLISWRVEGSEIDLLNQSAGKEEGITVSDKTSSYLRQTLLLAEKSEGKLDPTIGKLSRLWNIDGEDSTEEVPDEEEIQTLLADTGYEKIKQEENTIWLPEDMSLDLGSVGKGIGCDEIYTLLQENEEAKAAVISVGGSIFTYGTKEDGSDWTVAIADPRSEEGEYLGTLSFSGEKFISTSGDYEKYFIKDGKRYHHILDPDTGYPAESGLISTTIVCDSGLLSDGLSTACFVLGKEKGLKLLEEYGAEGIFVDSDKNVFVTDGLKEQFSLMAEGYFIAE